MFTQLYNTDFASVLFEGVSPVNLVLEDRAFLRAILYTLLTVLCLSSMGRRGLAPVLTPVNDFILRYRWQALLLLGLIATYRMSDTVMGVMANVFYIDQGFTKDQIAGVSKIFGLIMTLVGAGMGGLLIVRFGILPILLIGGIVITLIMEPVLALVMLATLPFITLLVYSKATKGIPMFTKVQRAQDRMVSVVRENAQGIRVIKALSKADHEKKRYENVNTGLANEELKANTRMAAINPLMNLFMNLGLVGVILVGAWRVNGGLSETGKIIAFTNYFTIITNAMMSISRIFVMVYKGIARADRIEEVLKAKDEMEIIGED